MVILPLEDRLQYVSVFFKSNKANHALTGTRVLHRRHESRGDTRNLEAITGRPAPAVLTDVVETVWTTP